jgi:GNAT superfamily N-acetyltransferase
MEMSAAASARAADFKVRPLVASDRRRWLALFRDYNAHFAATVADDVIELTWTRLLSEAEGCPVALMVVDGDDEPFGLAHLVFHRSTWSPTWYCYLEDLFVEPARRATGAGRALIAATYAEADRRGATRTYWVTDTANTGARRLYDDVATLSPFLQYRR